jgi:hypothetical protein
MVDLPGSVRREISLHPQDAAEVLVDFSRALALTATCEKLPHLRFHDASEHQLIRTAATVGAGLAVYISSNGPHLPWLLQHYGCPPQ